MSYSVKEQCVLEEQKHLEPDHILWSVFVSIFSNGNVVISDGVFCFYLALVSILNVSKDNLEGLHHNERGVQFYYILNIYISLFSQYIPEQQTANAS